VEASGRPRPAGGASASRRRRTRMQPGGELVMKVHFLFAVVAVQILIFQFASLRFMRAIPDQLLGGASLPPGAEAAVGRYRSGITRMNYGVGAVLLAGMILCAYVFPFTKGVPAILSVTAASLLSSGFFVVGYLRARSAAARIVDLVPDTGKRVAALQRREIGRYYNPVWELVPFLVLAASVVFTLWALPRLAQPYPLSFDAGGLPDAWGEGALRFVGILLLQAVCAFGLLLLTFWGLLSGPCISPRGPAAAADPEEAAKTAEALRRRNLRFFMAAKILISLQLGLVLLVKVETALGHAPPAWMKFSPWAMTLALLATFAVFVAQTTRDRRQS